MVNGLIIKELRNNLNLTQEQLADISGVSSRTIWSCEAGKANVRLDNLQKIANSLKVSLFTLLDDSISSNKANVNPSMNYDLIPIVNPLAAAGFASESFSIEEKDVKEYYLIPKFKNRQVDFLIELVGDSMRPRYKSGDLVACKILKDYNFIQWNKIHVIATREQGLLLKRIKKSIKENHILAVSDNTDFEPFDIPSSDVTGLAIVIGGVMVE